MTTHDQLAEVPRVTLTLDEAAQALGVSRRHFDRHVRPHVRVVYSGSARLVPVAELTGGPSTARPWQRATMESRLDLATSGPAVQVRGPRRARPHEQHEP